MDTTKIITLIVFGIVAVAISLNIIKQFLRNAKSKSEKEGKLNLSFCILFLAWVISYSQINMKSVSAMNDYIDTVQKNNLINYWAQIANTSILFIGLTNVWLIFCYLITQALSLLILDKRSIVKEIENNHYTYFLMKGIVFIGFVYCLMPTFELLLGIFLPKVEIPYYR